MRLTYLITTLLFMATSLAQAGQSKAEGDNKSSACLSAMASVAIDMEFPPIPPNAPDDYQVNLFDYYTVDEDCDCVKLSPDQSSAPEKWSCTVNFYKIPGKW